MERIIKRIKGSLQIKALSDLIYNLNFNQILDLEEIIPSLKDNENFWKLLIESYNSEFYKSIKDKNINFRTLYLDFLEIEQDENLEGYLTDVLKGNLDFLSKLKDYKEITKLFRVNVKEIEPITEKGLKINKKIPGRFEYSNSVDYPIKFTLLNFNLVIENFLTKGGEASIYEGTLNGTNVIFRNGTRGNLILPNNMGKYVPITYITFEDNRGGYVEVLQKLFSPEFSDKLFYQAIKFLDDMKKEGLFHNDLSAGNVMMDHEGNLKIIDFSPGSLGTRGYSSNDKESLSTVLIEIKNKDSFSNIADDLNKQINERTLLLPEPGEEYKEWIINISNNTRKIWKNTISKEERLQIYHLYEIYKILMKIEKGAEFFKDNMFPLSVISHLMEENENADKLSEIIYKMNIDYKDFILWLKEQVPHDEQNNILFNNIIKNSVLY